FGGPPKGMGMGMDPENFMKALGAMPMQGQAWGMGQAQQPQQMNPGGMQAPPMNFANPNQGFNQGIAGMGGQQSFHPGMYGASMALPPGALSVDDLIKAVAAGGNRGILNKGVDTLLNTNPA